MSDIDLKSKWTVLQTEAAKSGRGIEASPSGVQVRAGEVLVGVDEAARRYLLIPLRSGEAFADDRTGRAVHLIKVTHAGRAHLGAVCLQPDLDGVFAQFASELLAEIITATSPAQATVAALDRWRKLFAEADRGGLLSEPKLIGLLAELLTLEQVVAVDPERRLAVWTGPSGSQHDLRNGDLAIEVKATLVREGRLVSISSVDQLVPPPSGRLHLAHYRFELHATGDSLPDVVRRIRELGVEVAGLVGRLLEAGYREVDADHYEHRRYRLVERRVYDVEAKSFPRIVPASFIGGALPPGTLRLSYAIDLTNEPPIPLPDAAVSVLFEQLATVP